MSHPLSEKPNLQINLRVAATALAIVFVLTVIATQAARAQTFTVINNFTGEGDGFKPYAGLTFDGAGNLYGTTLRGGSGDFGTVFQLKHSNGGWILNTLYSFQIPLLTGAFPQGRVVFGPDGSLYGMTPKEDRATVSNSDAALFST